MTRALPTATAEQIHAWKPCAMSGFHSLAHVRRVFKRAGVERVTALDILKAPDAVIGYVSQVDQRWAACHLLPADFLPSRGYADTRGQQVFQDYAGLTPRLLMDLERYVAGDRAVIAPRFNVSAS